MENLKCRIPSTQFAVGLTEKANCTRRTFHGCIESKSKMVFQNKIFTTSYCHIQSEKVKIGGNAGRDFQSILMHSIWNKNVHTKHFWNPHLIDLFLFSLDDFFACHQTLKICVFRLPPLHANVLEVLLEKVSPTMHLPLDTRELSCSDKS